MAGPRWTKLADRVGRDDVNTIDNKFIEVQQEHWGTQRAQSTWKFLPPRLTERCGERSGRTHRALMQQDHVRGWGAGVKIAKCPLEGASDVHIKRTGTHKHAHTGEERPACGATQGPCLVAIQSWFIHLTASLLILGPFSTKIIIKKFAVYTGAQPYIQWQAVVLLWQQRSIKKSADPTCVLLLSCLNKTQSWVY